MGRKDGTGSVPLVMAVLDTTAGLPFELLSCVLYFAAVQLHSRDQNPRTVVATV